MHAETHSAALTEAMVEHSNAAIDVADAVTAFLSADARVQDDAATLSTLSALVAEYRVARTAFHEAYERRAASLGATS